MIEKMTIHTTNDQGNLTVELTGRLDTTTAPQLEEELKGVISEATDLALDFTNLAYISSAGLRVLLWAQKTMNSQGGAMVVRNANEDVREVFTITGFADILTLED